MGINGRVIAAVVTAVAVVAVGGGILVDRDEHPDSARPPVSSPTPPPAGEGSTRPGELTRGPLMAASNPVSVTIPALKVTSALTALGLNPDGTMEVPADAATVGWFTRAPTPGALGPAVLAGHVNWKGHDGAFAALDTLEPDDGIEVTRADGTTATFAVTRVARYPKDQFPSDAVYGAIDHAGLRLITCGGEFDTARHSYRDNVVVYATLTRTT